MDKEESFLKNRFSDLANSSYNRNIYTLYRLFEF